MGIECAGRDSMSYVKRRYWRVGDQVVHVTLYEESYIIMHLTRSSELGLVCRLSENNSKITFKNRIILRGTTL